MKKPRIDPLVLILVVLGIAVVLLYVLVMKITLADVHRPL